MAAPLAYDPQSLPLGLIGRPHATRGQVKLRLFNEGSRTLSGLALPLEVILEDPEGRRRDARLTVARLVSESYLLAFEGIDDRDQAATLTGLLLRLHRRHLPPLSEEEFYWQDLVGCRVEDQDGRALGTLQAVFDNGAHGVGVVERAGEELLLPLTKPFLLEVDVENRFLRIERLPEEDLHDEDRQEP